MPIPWLSDPETIVSNSLDTPERAAMPDPVRAGLVYLVNCTKDESGPGKETSPIHNGRPFANAASRSGRNTVPVGCEAAAKVTPDGLEFTCWVRIPPATWKISACFP